MGAFRLEIDISEKVNSFIKYGFAILLGVTAVCAAGIWFYQSSNRYLKIHDAEVRGSLVRVYARTNGNITELVAKNGAAVNAGDVIAKVKVSITPEQIKQLEQTVEVARKNLARVQEGVVVNQPVYTGGGGAGAEEAAAHLEKMEKLYAMGAISAAKRDEAAAAYEMASMGGGGSVSYQTVIQPNSPQVIQNAELQVKMAEASLAQAQQQSNATTITAPVPGTVYYTEIKVNDEIQPGQVICNVGNAKNLWVEAHLTEEQVKKIELGQFVSYEVNGNSLNGSVTEISAPKPVADPQNATPEMLKNAEKFTVRISLNPGNGIVINPGSKVTLKIAI